MVGKRKSKRPTEDREDLSKPSKWRLQHGRFSAPGYDVDPDSMPQLYIGWGDDDSLGESDSLLGDVQEEGHVFHAPGGHGWAVWVPIWQDILRHAPVGRVTPPPAAP